MIAIFLKWIAGTAFFGSLFWFSAHDWVALLLLGAWIVAITALVRSDLVDRFLWIPMVIALGGVFGSVFVLAIPDGITLAANELTLVMFIVSFEVLKKRRGHNQIAGVLVMKHDAH